MRRGSALGALRARWLAIPQVRVFAWPAQPAVDRVAPWLLAAVAVVVEAAILLHLADEGIAVGAALGVAALAACALSRSRYMVAIVAVLVVALLILVVVLAGGGVRMGVTVIAALSIVLLAAMANAIADAANRTLDQLASAYDAAIGELRRSAAEAHVARSRLMELGATVNNVYWETDASLRLRYLSRGFARASDKVPKMRMLLGFDPIDVAERLLGRYGRMTALLARMRKHEQVDRMRMAWRDEAGNLKRSTIYAYPRFDREGHLVRYQGVVIHVAQSETPQRSVAPPDRPRRL